MANSVVTSLIYRSVERLGAKGMGLVVSVILARLLAPSDFGQIAIVMVFINLAQILIDSGLSTALIQSATTRREDYSTVLYTSLLLSSLLIVILYLVAPAIAAFYESPMLIGPLRVFSFSLLIGALNSVLIAKMQKEMQFKQLMYCNLMATLLSGCIGICCAYQELGVWALVIYFFASSIISALLMLYAAHWLPQWCYSLRRAKELFAFGWKMMVSGLLCGLYCDLRTLIIGKLYSARDLGYYNRGDQFPSVISNTLDNAIQSVMFPVMSNAQHDLAQVKCLLKRTISMTSLVITPMMFILAAMTEPVIRILLTDKWLPAVPYMQCLCLGYASLPLGSSNLVALKAIGRSDLYMKLELFRRVVMLVILMLSIACFDSLLAIAVGMVVSSWIDYAITTWPIARLLKYGLGEQVGDIYKEVLASVLAAGATYGILLLEMALWPTLLLQAVVALSVYLCLCKWLRIAAFTQIYEAIGRICVHK